MSIAASLASLRWDDRKVNLIDTPGEPSFVADALAALRVCEGAVFVVNGVMGVEVTTERLWQRADELGLARLIFVNMLDRERADFFRTLDSLKASFGQHVVATEIPIGSEHELAGRGRPDRHEGLRARRRPSAGARRRSRSPRSSRARAEEYREKLMDEVAEAVRRADGALPRGRGDLPRGDRRRAEDRRHRRPALPGDLRRGHAQPRHGATARRASSRTCPRRPRRGPGRAGDGRRSSPTEDADAVALVFKTLADPYAGRINLFRVFQGVFDARHATCSTAAPTSRSASAQLLAPQGKDSEQADEFGPGDIGAVAKLKETHAGDVLSSRDQTIPLRCPSCPAPVMAFAIEPKTKGDEDKVFTALRRLQEEDPTHRRAPRRPDRRADRGRADPDARGGDRRADEGALRRRGDAQAAAGALPRDDQGQRQGSRALQEADRRPRPVRRLPHRGRAAASTAPASSS